MTTTKQFIPLSYYQRPKHTHIHRVSKEYESKRQKVKQRERERGRDSGGKDQSKRANAAQWSTINMACKRTRETHTHTQSSSDERGGLTDGPAETHH